MREHEYWFIKASPSFLLEIILMRYAPSVALFTCKGTVPKSLWSLGVVLAGLLVVELPTRAVRADTTLDSGTTTVSTGTNLGYLTVGNTGTATLEVIAGGYATSSVGYLGFYAGSDGTATVSGGTWAASANLLVGVYGNGTLNVTGGSVTSSFGFIGAGAGSVGTATVSSGTWANGVDLTVGSNGTGTLNVDGGLVSAAGTLTQGTYGSINLNSGGTLQIGVGGTTGVLGVSMLNNNGTLLFNRSDASTYSGVISGTGAVTKQGTGTLKLTGSNSYSGATAVVEGGLTVNGAIGSGDVTVASGAMLSGSGTIGGNTTIHGGHTLGDPIGLQTIGGDLTYALEYGKASGPNVNWDLIANTSTDSGQFGQVQVLRNLDFSSATAFEMAFNGPGSTVDWSNSFWATDEHWTVYSVSGSLTNFANLVLAAGDWIDGDGKAFSSYLSGASFELIQEGNTVVLNYSRSSSPIPEIDPRSFGSAFALLLGWLGLVERPSRRAIGLKSAA